MDKKGYAGLISAMMVVILLQINNVIANVVGIVIVTLKAELQLPYSMLKIRKPEIK